MWHWLGEGAASQNPLLPHTGLLALPPSLSQRCGSLGCAVTHTVSLSRKNFHC
jgi:hypothetical protein